MEWAGIPWKNTIEPSSYANTEINLYRARPAGLNRPAAFLLLLRYMLMIGNRGNYSDEVQVSLRRELGGPGLTSVCRTRRGWRLFIAFDERLLSAETPEVLRVFFSFHVG